MSDCLNEAITKNNMVGIKMASESSCYKVLSKVMRRHVCRGKDCEKYVLILAWRWKKMVNKIKGANNSKS